MPEEFIDDIIAGTTEEQVVDAKNIVQENADQQVVVEKEIVEEKVIDQKDQKDEKVVEAKAKSEPETESQESIDALAEKLGWNKDHSGPEKVDAATYILRSREIQDTMRGHNKDLKNQVSSLQESINALKEHNEIVYKAEVKKLEGELTKLRKEKRAAVELADVEKVDALDEQIESIQKDLNEPKKTKESKTPDNEAYDVWIKDNQWYETDEEMAIFADTVAEQFKGAPIERIYNLVRQKVQEVFPDKFESAETKVAETKETKEKPVGPTSPVESASNRETSKSFTADDLTADQRMIMKQFVGQGIMTEKQYIDDIAKLQEG